MAPLRAAVAAAIALASAGCTDSPADRAEAKERLMQTSRDWSKAASTGDVAAILSYWADDARVIPPGATELRGKAALKANVEQSLKMPGFHIEWEPVEASLSEDGSMGYLIERTRTRMNGPDGKPVEQSFRGVTIWRRQADGGWKNVLDISNAPPPVSAPVTTAPAAP